MSLPKIKPIKRKKPKLVEVTRIHRPFAQNATTFWEYHRKKLKVIFQEKGIITCEIGLPGCAYDNMLSFAHRHKRAWYKMNDFNRPKLGDFDQVLLACIPCHQIIEDDKELTNKYFKLKRGV